MVSRKEQLANVERVVIKVGTSSITQGGSTPSEAFMDLVAKQISEI